MNSTWTALENSTFFQNTSTIEPDDQLEERGNSVVNKWDHKKTEDNNKNIIESNFENGSATAKRTSNTKNLESVWKFKGSAPLKQESSKSMTKTSWSNDILESADSREQLDDLKLEVKEEMKDDDFEDGNEKDADSLSGNEPAHHSRRPMNAFLIFCKCHRPVVRQKYPQLENRGVTKILGEWWAQLEADEKTAYQDLAKEFKDAFFKANPNFRWYKLPAPPLRTLNTRPGNVSKSPEPKIVVPVSSSLSAISSSEAEFTPGKLADESQLGSITSLMNMDSQFSKSTITSSTSSNANKMEEATLCTPTPVNIETALPPKPIKKRLLVDHHVAVDNKNVARNIFIHETTNTSDIITTTTTTSNNHTLIPSNHASNANSNITQQELIEKVVDNYCSSSQSDDQHDVTADKYDKQIKEAPRKSGRSCKGKRYEKFMVEGKLLGNKKDKRDRQLKSPVNSSAAASFDLEQTIKRLAERTRWPAASGGGGGGATDGDANESEYNNNNNSDSNDNNNRKRARTNSGTSADTVANVYRASDFNLEAKIKALPNLSFDKFLMKKKLAKKKKPSNKIRNGDEHCGVSVENTPVGSRKRKANKHITRIPSPSNYLSGLATLAEVAAKTAKIAQQQ